MKGTEGLLQFLADGKFHSGQDIAHLLGCSRSAVWKKIALIRQMPGLEVDSVTGRGYRLREPLELLEQQRILAALPAQQREKLDACHVLGSVVSTNALALQHLPARERGIAWFAEHQTAGRGRRGRSWFSPFGRNIYFSLAWQFNMSLAQVSGLSIATGAVLADVLHAHGLRDHGLKWPNDLVWNKRKLGGILLEVQGETEGPATVVIGIGINLQLDDRLQQEIDQPAACLREAGLTPGRNQLAADLLGSTVEMCQVFSRQGLQPFVDRWRKFDVYSGRMVKLIGPSQVIAGTNLGVAGDGGLRLKIGGQVQTFYAGELSLRDET